MYIYIYVYKYCVYIHIYVVKCVHVYVHRRCDAINYDTRDKDITRQCMSRANLKRW